MANTTRPSVPPSHSSGVEHRRQLANVLNRLNQTTPDYSETTNERAAGVTPVNYQYPPGDVRRYGLGQPVIITVEEHGAQGDSDASGSGASDAGTDDSAAFQAAFDYGVSLDQPFIIKLAARAYKLAAGIDCSAARHSYGFIGEGRDKTFLCPTPFGASEKLFDGGSDPPASTIFADFSVRRTVQNKAHPIIFFYPKASSLSLKRIKVSAIGNTVVFAGVVFNLDWEELDFHSCGWQPLYKEPSGVTVTVTADSADITATGNIFDPGDVGRVFYVQQHASGSSSQPTNSALVTTIASVTSATQATLTANSFATGSGKGFSFDSVTGTISTGTNTLTLDTDCLEESDEGRAIYIDGAGGDGGRLVLCAIIEKVTSGTTCTLDRNASSTATSKYVWFTPNIFMGDLAQEFAGEVGASINDIVISELNIERFRGPAVLLQGGTNVHFRNPKFHGRAFGEALTTFAAARHALILSGTSRVVVTGAQLEFGCHGTSSGYFIVADDSSLIVDQAIMSGCVHGGYLFDFRSSDEIAQLHIGRMFGARDFTKDAGVVNTSGTVAINRVTGGYIGGISRDAERQSAQPPAVAKGFRSAHPQLIADDGFVKYAPGRATSGFAVISAGSTTGGIFYYRISGSPGIDMVFPAAGGDVETTTGALDGTTGNDGVLTVSPHSDGFLYVENRLGFSVTVVVTFLC